MLLFLVQLTYINLIRKVGSNMALRPTLSAYGGLTQSVDRLIGDAFPVVHAVYENMDNIVAVGEAVRASVVGEPMLKQRRVTEHGGTGALGSTVSIPFTDLDIVLTNVIASNVRIQGTDGAVYFADSGAFTCKVNSIGLLLTLKADAPAACAGAPVEWFAIYGV
jgi:hypothetical protein